MTLTILADDFADSASQTEAGRRPAEQPALAGPRVRSASGVLALGFWLVKGSLDAMRLGLSRRFMGVLGIALGPALVLGFGSLVMPLWLFALGLLFRRRWPRGMPPAWQPAAPSRGSARAAAGDPIRARAPAEPAASSNGGVEAVGPGVHEPRLRARTAAGRTALGPPPRALVAAALCCSRREQLESGVPTIDAERTAISRSDRKRDRDRVRLPGGRGGAARRHVSLPGRGPNGRPGPVVVTQRDDDGTITWRSSALAEMQNGPGQAAPARHPGPLLARKGPGVVPPKAQRVTSFDFFRRSELLAVAHASTPNRTDSRTRYDH